MKRRRGVNIYQLFTDQFIWPRGLPLELIREKLRVTSALQNCKVGIWQGLADGDPDVDAIYRLVFGKSCIFNQRAPVVLTNGLLCPFNSQNTAIRRELFPLLYLPAHVSFRFTDILRGLVAQPIMWSHGYSLGFTSSTVLQDRNPHDYMKDFVSEIPMYMEASRIIDSVRGSISTSASLAENLISAYRSLVKAHILSDQEIRILEAWLLQIP